MSSSAYIFGAVICEDIPNTDRANARFRNNILAISSLPAHSDYSKSVLVSQQMFAVPSSNVEPFYRHQIIHFGGSYNHLDQHWHLWLEQFEGLLSRMTWESTFAQVEMEMSFRGSLRWTPIGNKYSIDSVTKWEFSGGPRFF